MSLSLIGNNPKDLVVSIPNICPSHVIYNYHLPIRVRVAWEYSSAYYRKTYMYIVLQVIHIHILISSRRLLQPWPEKDCLMFRDRKKSNIQTKGSERKVWRCINCKMHYLISILLKQNIYFKNEKLVFIFLGSMRKVLQAVNLINISIYFIYTIWYG